MKTYLINFHNWRAANLFAANIPCRRKYSHYFPLDNVVIIQVKRADESALKRAAEAYKAVSIRRI